MVAPFKIEKWFSSNRQDAKNAKEEPKKLKNEPPRRQERQGKTKI
jgi:hypothetical protein